ncbi:MAG: hypothetical protein ABTQ32_32135 [Myxococcaceae bacterium]
MRRLLVALLCSGCVGAEFVRQPDPKPCVDPPTVEPRAEPNEPAVRKVIVAFVEAVERKDFEVALSMLGASWRKQYSSARLQQDFGSEPRGAQLVSRLKASSAGPITVVGSRASLVVGEGRVARLTLEPDGWRLASLDGDQGRQ